MPINKLNPYLNYDGNAEQAIKLYETALGAKTEHVMRFGDVAETKASPADSKRIMHALLQLGSGVVMLSDTMPGMPTTAEANGNTQVALHFDDPAEMARRFEALSVGGKVTLPLHDTFWGAKFGMLTDAFGIRWMFNCELKR
jgi:PhnB protein